MIAKLTTGNGFGGALRYDVRAGKGTPRELARVLDACGVSFDFEDNGDLLINPKQVGFDFRQQTMGYTGDGVIRRPVYHWALAYSPKDNVSESQMVTDAKEFLQRIGFDDTQYVMTAHYDKEHHHLHVLTNVINNQGRRIPTMGLIDKAHAAAAAITRERGYAWGTAAKKETVDKAHQPHEKVRMMMKPLVKEALTKCASLRELQMYLIDNHGIMCNFTEARDGERGRISFAIEYQDQVHSFKGSSLDRQLSFGWVKQALEANARKVTKKQDDTLWYMYKTVYRPRIEEAQKMANNSYLLYKTAKEQYGITGKEIAAQYDILKDTFSRVKQCRDSIDKADGSKSLLTLIGAALALVNPLLGLAVGLAGRVIAETNRSANLEARRTLIAKAETIRKDIEVLKKRQAEEHQNKVEALDKYLEDKAAKEVVKTELNAFKMELERGRHDIAIAALKQEFPFKDKGHMQYVIHGHYDASIFRAEEGEGIYRAVPSGKFRDYDRERKHEIKDDYYEKAREALKERVMFVAGDRGPTAFYETLLEQKKHGDFRVGDIRIEANGKITFGRERVFGDPSKTAYQTLHKEAESKKQLKTGLKSGHSQGL